MNKIYKQKKEMQERSRSYKQPKKKDRRGTHTKKRAEQRYNLNLTKVDEDLIVAKIMRGECLYLRNDGENEFHYVKHKNLPVKILYNPDYRMIITPYPFVTEEYNLLEKMEKERIEAMKHPLQDLHEEIKERDNTDMKKTKLNKKEISMKRWVEIHGYESFTIGCILYMKRADVFLKNNGLISRFVMNGTLKKDVDFVTLKKSDLPEALRRITQRNITSYIKYSTLERLSNSDLLEAYSDVRVNIRNIIDAGSKPLTARNLKEYADNLPKLVPVIMDVEEFKSPTSEEEDFKAQVWVAPTLTFEELEERINDPEVLSIQKNIEVLRDISKVMGKEEAMQEMINRFIADPKNVKLMPYAIEETTIIDMLKRNIETTNYAIKELEEKEEIKFRLETSNEKQLYYLKQVDELTLMSVEREAELQKGYDVITKMLEEHTVETTFFKSLHKDLRDDNVAKSKEIEVLQEQETELLKQAALDQMNLKRLKEELASAEETIKELSKDKSTMDKIKAFFN